MKLVYSILLSKEINKDEFVSFVKDTEHYCPVKVDK